MISPADIFEAKKRISPYLIETPIEYSNDLSKSIGANVYFKLENLQLSGSFKPRGGVNKILKTRVNSPQAEFIAPTAGGHGVGLSYAGKILDANVHILMPNSADPDRIKDIREHGASIQFYDSVPEARKAAIKSSEENGYIFVSAYNDTEMIEGGGTIGVELLKQLPNIDCLVCGVGGGGYISGMAIVLKAINPDIKIIAVQQDTTPLVYNWFKTGQYRMLPFKPSIAEGIGALVEEESITLPLIQKYVDDFMIVNDNEIKEALFWMLKHHKHYVEPSAVVGLAALKKHPEIFKDYKNILTVITGRNLSYKRFEELIHSHS